MRQRSRLIATNEETQLAGILNCVHVRVLHSADLGFFVVLARLVLWAARCASEGAPKSDK